VAPTEQYETVEDEPRRGGGFTAMLVGGAVVAAAGVALGFAALSKLNAPPAPPPDDAQVSIVVDKSKPPPVPKSGAPMEVLGPGMAEAAMPPPVVAEEPLPEGAASPESALPPSGPHFDCGRAVSRAQTMVCADPQLAALDRRMARAYAEAGAAGMPASQLRSDQAEWRMAREDAAAHSPDAVVEVYELRIRELEDFADGAASR
jgi:uncharacterized protein YecT (DUF1311 family)